MTREDVLDLPLASTRQGQALRGAQPPVGGDVQPLPLAPRHLAALRLLARGMTYNEAAAHLGLSYFTVTNSVREAYERLRVNSNVQAFIALGWLTVPKENR